MKALLIAFGLCVLLSACAAGDLAAPPAPCASTARDCGPAKPLNTGVALAAPGQVAVVG
jgi:hypothetical protein